MVDPPWQGPRIGVDVAIDVACDRPSPFGSILLCKPYNADYRPCPLHSALASSGTHRHGLLFWCVGGMTCTTYPPRRLALWYRRGYDWHQLTPAKGQRQRPDVPVPATDSRGRTDMTLTPDQLTLAALLVLPFLVNPAVGGGLR